MNVIIQTFVAELNAKFRLMHTEAVLSGAWSEKRTITAEPGTRFVRLVMRRENETGGHAYAFIDMQTGGLCKADGWKAPAKGKDKQPIVRYDLTTDDGFEDAVFNADLYGSFLYANYEVKHPEAA